MEEIWSNTDFPYMCLKDEVRTLAFKKAILAVVKQGDIVADVGSGSGILSFFAAQAGAKKVYAVEIEHTLATCIRESILLNNLEKQVDVVESNIFKAELPHNVDVVISELIDTGLLDELQTPALNNLRTRGIITEKTVILPSRYETFIELIYSDNSYYGYKIVAPKHEWPFYSDLHTNWAQTELYAVSNKVKISDSNFMAGLVNEDVDKTVELSLDADKVANGIRISGLVTLTGEITLGATNALNGDKIISIPPISKETKVNLRISYKMGCGLGKLHVERL